MGPTATKDILDAIVEQVPKLALPPETAPKAPPLEGAKAPAQDAAPKAPAPTALEPSPQRASVFEIQLLDEAGEPIPCPSGCYDPALPAARRLMFSIAPTDTEPTVQQMEFCRSLGDYEHAIREVYLEAKKPDEQTFKTKFVELYYLSRLILEGHVTEVTEDGQKKKRTGKTLAPDVAKKEIELLNQSLIDDAAPVVKNQHLKDLTIEAMKLIPFFLVAYVALRLLDPTSALADKLMALEIWPKTASNFTLLWVGTFVGVVLSYAIRTHQFTLTDLTRTDADYFSPRNRLLLAGGFATLLAYFAMVGLGELKIGELSLLKIANDPMVALVIGVVLGIFEYRLTATVEKRAGGMYPADSK